MMIMVIILTMMADDRIIIKIIKIVIIAIV